MALKKKEVSYGKKKLLSIHICRNTGFTLIELMIVVAIIAILAAIAYPSYIEYKIRTNRADVQKEMILIAQQMAIYKNAKGSFAGATVDLVYGGTTYPRNNVLYNLEFAQSPTTAIGWTLIAKPINTNSQKDNGWICLDNQGQRSWVKGVDNCIKLSNTSKWDGR